MIVECVQSGVKKISGYCKHSAVFSGLGALNKKVGNAWVGGCFGGALVMRDNTDECVRESVSYRAISAFFMFVMKLFNVLDKAMQGSLLIRVFARYEIGVFALVALAPFLPTMVCVTIALATLLSFVVRTVLDKKNGLDRFAELQIDSVSFFVLLFIGVTAIFAFTSLAGIESVKVWLVYAVFIAFYFVVVGMATTRERLYALAATFAVSGFLASLYGIYQQFFGSNLGHAWIDLEMFGTSGMRAYSTFGNPNVFGEYLLLLIPIVVALFWVSKNWFARICYGGIAAAAMLAMMFTQSRGCWLALIFGALIFVWFTDKRYLLLLFVFAALMPYVLPQSVINRFASIGNVQDSSTSYRLFIWLGTINMLKDFALWGVGLGNAAFAKVYPFYSYSEIVAPQAHNLYLQILAEMGVVGFFVFAAVVGLLVKKILHFHAMHKGIAGEYSLSMWRGTHGRDFEVILAVAVLSGVAAFLVQGMFDYVWYNYRVILLFWIVIALGVATLRQLSLNK